MLSKEQIDYAEKVAKDLIKEGFGNSSCFTAGLVADLITMLRESEAKANAAVKALAKMVMECYRPLTMEQAIALVEKKLPRDCDGARHAEGGK